MDFDGIWVDDYFNQNGNYLYTDNKNTDNINIIQQSDWEDLITQFPKDLVLKNESSRGFSEALDKVSTGIENKVLSAEAYSNIFTNILSRMDDVDMSKLYNDKVSIKLYNANETSYKPFNNPSSIYANASSGKIDNKIRITASILKESKPLLNTVSNVQNLLGAHEYIGHGIKGWGDKTGTHHKVYEYQIYGHPSWINTTTHYKHYQLGNYLDYLYPKR